MQVVPKIRRRHWKGSVASAFQPYVGATVASRTALAMILKVWINGRPLIWNLIAFEDHHWRYCLKFPQFSSGLRSHDNLPLSGLSTPIEMANVYCPGCTLLHFGSDDRASTPSSSAQHLHWSNPLATLGRKQDGALPLLYINLTADNSRADPAATTGSWQLFNLTLE